MEKSVLMKKVNSEGIVPTAAELSEIERQIGYKLPQDYIDLLSDLNAEFPVRNSFPAGNHEGIPQTAELVRFIRLEQLAKTYKEINIEQEKDDEDEDFPALSFNGSNLISGFLPFAETRTSMDSYIFLNVDETRPDYGAVYYWDSSWDFLINEIIKLADSLPEFIKTVKYNSYELSPEELAKCKFGRSSGATKEELAEIIRKIKEKRGL